MLSFFRDSLAIDDSKFSFSWIFSPEIFQDTLLGFGDGTFRSINLFHARTGAFLTNYERDSIDSYIIPVKDMGCLHIQDDEIYILNTLVRKIFVFTLDKQFKRKIDLVMPDAHTKPTYEGIFTRVGDTFYISTVHDGPLAERFKNSKLVSVFDLEGNFSHSFGSYPENYTQGNLVLSTNEHKVIKGDRMFILNVAGLPVLKEYSLAGELQAIYPLSPPSFDTEIGFYQSDPFASPLTDQMNGLALDPADPRDILYASFSSFDTRERSSYGLSTYRWIILRIDLDAKTI
ncbi:hypothetical protein A3SI_01576 [Nitritalea halalkaliphila LW7]|uniref:Uncharacterized protein n=1 Tax=Nitritalea halalkaliphila LW7 TaxID=1189621 RepID=I5CA71_9BACT|nr:hypothetical protein [Nitritalea halalkaliphila]EIM78723.1 hypothetical protein A3SI_01576 [Nitritalea halalkaliphila LW7]